MIINFVKRISLEILILGKDQFSTIDLYKETTIKLKILSPQTHRKLMAV